MGLYVQMKRLTDFRRAKSEAKILRSDLAEKQDILLEKYSQYLFEYYETDDAIKKLVVERTKKENEKFREVKEARNNFWELVEKEDPNAFSSKKVSELYHKTNDKLEIIIQGPEDFRNLDYFNDNENFSRKRKKLPDWNKKCYKVSDFFKQIKKISITKEQFLNHHEVYQYLGFIPGLEVSEKPDLPRDVRFDETEEIMSVVTEVDVEFKAKDSEESSVKGTYIATYIIEKKSVFRRMLPQWWKTKTYKIVSEKFLFGTNERIWPLLDDAKLWYDIYCDHIETL